MEASDADASEPARCLLVSEGHTEGQSIFAQFKLTNDEFEWVPGVVVRLQSHAGVSDLAPPASDC